MTRSPPVRPRSLLVPLLVIWGCVDPSASLSLSIEGPEKLPELLDEVLVNWDGEVTWTREIQCVLEWDGEGSSYSVAAHDRSLGDGFGLELLVQRFEGPGDYERDSYQPQAAFSLSLEESGNSWRFASDSGGTCDFFVDERSRSGSLACSGIPIIENLEVSSSTIDVEGNWSCGVLTRGGAY